MANMVNLLALDGGGIRGLSELLILDEVMKRLQFDLELPELPRPCHYFDLIGGTSTGGLIALMLGRLQMTTREALDVYAILAEAIFSRQNRNPGWKDGAYKAETVEAKIKELVASKGLGDRMRDENLSTCKAFVCALPALNTEHPRLFRTYRVRENATINCMIWEAARATTAAPTIFERVCIGDEGGAKEEFLDGGLGHNNPTSHVLEEARRVFGDNASLGCLVSLGTGHPGVIGLSKPDRFQKILSTRVVDLLRSIATNCEGTATDTARKFRNLPRLFFRFSVTHGAGLISLEEWSRMSELHSHTRAYLNDITVSASVDALVRILAKQQGADHTVVRLQSICAVTPQAAKSASSAPSLSARRKPQSTERFVGRCEILAVLSSKFSGRKVGRSHRRREHALWGVGGGGKTTTTLKFAEIYAHRFDTILWIDGTNTETIERSYVKIAIKLLKLSADQPCSIEIALNAIESLEEEYLLIFDGADDVDQIYGLMPPGTCGNIIFTSRDPTIRGLSAGQKTEVGELDLPDAIHLLLTAAGLSDCSAIQRKQARAICEELGCLALAVDQAGAYIANGQCNLDSFLSTYKEHRRDLLQSPVFRGSDYDRTVYTTLDVSYRALEKRTATMDDRGRAARLALQILNIFAFWHFKDIPEEIFRRAAEAGKQPSSYGRDIDPHGELDEFCHLPADLLKRRPDGLWDDRAFRQGISAAISLSIITKRSSSNAFSMHKLVQCWLRDRLSRQAQLHLSRIARSTLAASINDDDDDLCETYRFSSLVLPHIITALDQETALAESHPNCRENMNFCLTLLLTYCRDLSGGISHRYYSRIWELLGPDSRELRLLDREGYLERLLNWRPKQADSTTSMPLNLSANFFASNAERIHTSWENTQEAEKQLRSNGVEIPSRKLTQARLERTTTKPETSCMDFLDWVEIEGHV
ncbi:hypothetical protein MMC25_008268 [Agyrium rufum]|nr:hypothetical protein [Agyrium rufum]